MPVLIVVVAPSIRALVSVRTTAVAAAVGFPATFADGDAGEAAADTCIEQPE